MPTRVMKIDGLESAGICRGDRRVVFEDDEEKGTLGLVKNSCIQTSSCSDESSSIGKNSDLSQNSMEKTEEGEEVQSPFKDAIEALEEVLPIRRGISRFYNGKSKSFTTLAEASSPSSSSPSSIKHIAKPENPYTRRRRNLLAYNLTLQKNRVSCLRTNSIGISKRVTTSNRTTLALGVAMSNKFESNKQVEECNSSAKSSLLASSPVKDFTVWRSFSLVDLHQCASVDTKTCIDSDLLVEQCKAGQ